MFAELDLTSDRAFEPSFEWAVPGSVAFAATFASDSVPTSYCGDCFHSSAIDVLATADVGATLLRVDRAVTKDYLALMEVSVVGNLVGCNQFLRNLA